MNTRLLPKACRSVSSFSVFKKLNPAFNIAHYETSNNRRSTLNSLPKYNNAMNSIFKTKYSFKSYSTNVNTSALVEEYSKLSTEQVYTLLRTGPKLNEQSIIQLQNIGFDAYSLTLIIVHLQDTDKYKVVDKFVHDNVVQHDKFVRDNAKTIPKLKDVILLVVIWIEDLITKSQIKTSIGIIKYDILEQFRNGEEYSYLRNLTNPKKMNELEGMIGKNIILPNLSLIDSELIPKDFQPSTPYLLTKQRFNILKRIVEEYINKPIYSNGLIPSGPHGISKSYTVYLIVCYALVNSFPVLYIPKCTSWVSMYGNNMNEEAADTYLVQQFFRLNGDLLENTNGPFNNCTFFKETNFISIRKAIFTQILNAQNFHTFCIFDDHNELWREYNNNIIPIKYDYFNGQTTFEHVSCSNTFTVFCGSAHSKFENFLPSGYETSRLTIIQPPTEMEFKTLISNYGMDPSDYNRIEYVTGRIPVPLGTL